MFQYKTNQKSKLVSMGCLRVKTPTYDQAMARLMNPDEELADVLLDALKEGCLQMNKRQVARLDTKTIEYQEDYVYRIKESYFINLKIYIPYKKSKRRGLDKNE